MLIERWSCSSVERVRLDVITGTIFRVKKYRTLLFERGGKFLLSPASDGEVLISMFDWTVSVTRNDFFVSSEPHVGI